MRKVEFEARVGVEWSSTQSRRSRSAALEKVLGIFPRFVLEVVV